MLKSSGKLDFRRVWAEKGIRIFPKRKRLETALELAIVKNLNKCLRMEYKCICIYNERKHQKKVSPKKKPGACFGYFDEKNFNNDFYFSVKMTNLIN